MRPESWGAGGVQPTSGVPCYLRPPPAVKLVSTAKHYSAYDLENSTDALGVYYIRQNFTAVVTQQDLAQYYWPPFLSAVQRGQVR